MEIKIAIFNFTFFYSLLYSFILSIASSINSEANKSYKIFNSFYIEFRETTKLDKRRLTVNQIKVSILVKNYLKNSIFISDQHNY